MKHDEPLQLGPRAWAVVERHADSVGATVEDIMGPKRHPHLLRARRACWAEIHETFGWSYTSIAEVWQCDHVTVQTAVTNTRRVRRLESVA